MSPRHENKDTPPANITKRMTNLRKAITMRKARIEVAGEAAEGALAGASPAAKPVVDAAPSGSIHLGVGTLVPFLPREASLHVRRMCRPSASALEAHHVLDDGLALFGNFGGLADAVRAVLAHLLRLA